MLIVLRLNNHMMPFCFQRRKINNWKDARHAHKCRACSGQRFVFDRVISCFHLWVNLSVKTFVIHLTSGWFFVMFNPLFLLLYEAPQRAKYTHQLLRLLRVGITIPYLIQKMLKHGVSRGFLSCPLHLRVFWLPPLMKICISELNAPLFWILMRQSEPKQFFWTQMSLHFEYLGMKSKDHVTNFPLSSQVDNYLPTFSSSSPKFKLTSFMLS